MTIHFLFLSFIDLPPGYVYPGIAIGYRNGPSPEDVQLAEPVSLEAVQVEPPNHAPQSLSSLGEGLDCQAVVRPLSPEKVVQEVNEGVVVGVLEEREEVTEVIAHYVPAEKEVGEQGPSEDEVLVCPPAASPVCEAASCPIPLSTEDSERPQAVITLDEEEDDEAVEEIQLEQAQKVNMPGEQDTKLASISEPSPHSTAVPEPETMDPDEVEDNRVLTESKEAPDDASEDLVCLSPGSVSALSQSKTAETLPHNPLVPCYWSLELLIAAAFCTDVPPFPLFTSSAPSAARSLPNPHQGMELLSELADLELQRQRHTSGKSQGEEQQIILFFICMTRHSHRVSSGEYTHFFCSLPSLSTETNSYLHLRPSLCRAMSHRLTSIRVGLKSLWWILTCP